MYHFGNLFYSSWTAPGFSLSPLGSILFAVIVVWSVVWKGLALWRAAHTNSKIWFIVFLIINTLGILEILYLYIFSKKSMAMSASPSGEEKKK